MRSIANDPAKRNRILVQTGITEDGKPVVSFFKMVETRGLPLDITVEILIFQGMVPDWCDFVRQAVKCGWKLDRTILRLEVVIIDLFGPEYFKSWQQKMQEAVKLMGLS